MAENRTIEEIVEDIENQVARLEKGNLPLEEAIESYKAGVETVAELRSRLSEAKLQISEIQSHLAELESDDNEEFES